MYKKLNAKYATDDLSHLTSPPTPTNNKKM